MYRASIHIVVEQDGDPLAERSFGQEDQKLDDLREMFLSTLFQRMQDLGGDVFDDADEKLEQLEAAREEKEAKKKSGGRKKKSTKTKTKKNAEKSETRSKEDADEKSESE